MESERTSSAATRTATDASLGKSWLFEISWEVCNKVGGIHTVLSSKANTALEQFGDRYITVGPLLLSDTDRDVPFDDEPEHDDFVAACRTLGYEVRIGRWRIPGRPRCMLVEFSSLYDRKDAVLARLWEDYEVDSLAGAWDYIEPVLFGHAAGQVIEEWYRSGRTQGQQVLVQAHEWMTGSALLHLSVQVPEIATVFTTHATVLGRAISSNGRNPDDGLEPDEVLELARGEGVTAKHSMEGAAARAADVFTTVSQVTAREAETLHRRAPTPILPNGIDPRVLDELVGGAAGRASAREALTDLARRFLGMPDLDHATHGSAAFVCVSGRYEFHNKGIDLLLDALGRLNAREGRPVVLFALVPAGNSGLRGEVRNRLECAAPTKVQDPIGLATHHLFDEDHDPIAVRCRELGLGNATGDRVKILHVPIYLHEQDGLLKRSYEAVLSAMDLGAFPSFYEPWGYTPQETLGVGVPTITSDYAGFGRWASAEHLGPTDGIAVLERVGKDHDRTVARLAEQIEAFLSRPTADAEALRTRCQQTAARTAWSDLFRNYRSAYTTALQAAEKRDGRPVSRPRAAVLPVKVEPATSVGGPRLSYFDVSATLPPELAPLERVSRNYWWCWDSEAPSLFEEISPRSWHACGHNPVHFLRQAWPEDLRRKAAEPGFVERVNRVAARFDAYLAARRTEVPAREGSPARFDARHPTAYFCAEYGLHESLPIYSGGLGVLAGDHLKSASDLNFPFVAVGLFYRMGYMKQALSTDGQQLALDRENVPERLAMDPVLDATGERVKVRVSLPGRDLTLQAWTVMVGRVTLYLLDANCPENRDEDKDITRNLYGGDHEMRIKQLVALGRGGVRLLRQLGIEPSAYHLNEGHAAFSSLERVAQLIREDGMTFEAAREWVRATTAFTTHTPVPAGHDRFSEDLMRRYFSDVPDWGGVPWERFLRLGRADLSAPDFNMTYLALSFASVCNGVSKMHGEVSRELLHEYWPSLLEEEVPVQSVTNGIHLGTWTHPCLAELMGVTGRPVTGDDFRNHAKDLDPKVLWHARQGLKLRLKTEVSARLERAFVGRNDSPLLLNRILEGLDEDALWIGFARRFAPYKRAALLYKDIARLADLCNAEGRPVRILVAGKAHPRDGHGQDILKGIAQLARGDELVGRVIVVEDYDIDLARFLVQGVDVWLNNPTRGLEASGTSGMKVAANGGLNLSIADGWWPEAADGKNGWTIGSVEKAYQDQELQDQYDASTLYRMLEEELVPLYFDRDADGVPQGWMERVIHDLETVPSVFNTDRMVEEYLETAYRPLCVAQCELRDDRSRAQRIADGAQRIRRGFENIKVVELRHADLQSLHVGDTVEAWVRVDLDGLCPDDVEVELVFGNAPGDGQLRNMVVVTLEPTGESEGNVHAFRGAHCIERSGRFAQGIRVRPRSLSASPSALRDLVLWA